MPDRRQRSLDTLIAGDLAVLDRDVQVLADEDTFTGQVKAGQFKYGHPQPAITRAISTTLQE